MLAEMINASTHCKRHYARYRDDDNANPDMSYARHKSGESLLCRFSKGIYPKWHISLGYSIPERSEEAALEITGEAATDGDRLPSVSQNMPFFAAARIIACLSVKRLV